MKLVTPRVELIGYTSIDWPGFKRYLTATGNEEFIETANVASCAGIADGEILCSFYAKLCYAALRVGANLNVTKVRDIAHNIRATLSAGHTSVFEHAQINFVAWNVSRVLTHEMVRHRVGTAFSQTSGRYVRSDELVFCADPLLQELGVLTGEEQEEELLRQEAFMLRMSERISTLDADFTAKKKLTSAMRRFLPNGQANEIGFSHNITSLRHVIQMRTGRAAEQEIRQVYQEVYRHVKAKFPLLFDDAVENVVDGALEITGMRTVPY